MQGFVELILESCITSVYYSTIIPREKVPCRILSIHRGVWDSRG